MYRGAQIIDWLVYIFSGILSNLISARPETVVSPGLGFTPCEVTRQFVKRALHVPPTGLLY